MKAWHGWCTVFLLLSVTIMVSGCEGMLDLGASVAASTGLVSARTAESGKQALKTVARESKQLTPEQEYYLGRAVAATILQRQQPYDQPALTRYVNLIGQTLSQASDLPATFAGYHFLILDSDEINAWAAPTGFVFVTRGMLRLCRSEDEVAAVLAHEIGHVQGQHGVGAIKSSRITAALVAFGADVASKRPGGAQLAQLTNIFSGAVEDMITTLFEKGYSREKEEQADLAAIEILKRVGYDPQALGRVLEAMKPALRPDGAGFAKTHPAPDDRIAMIQPALEERAVIPVATRAQRFRRAMANL